MNPFPTFSEGVNKSVHMDVRKLKRKAETEIQFYRKCQTCKGQY